MNQPARVLKAEVGWTITIEDIVCNTGCQLNTGDVMLKRINVSQQNVAVRRPEQDQAHGANHVCTTTKALCRLAYCQKALPFDSDH
eukprot:358921-Chlamydomonas_euryale.AAC.1